MSHPAQDELGNWKRHVLLLLDRVARGETTMRDAEELAKEIGIKYEPVRKQSLPQWDGTCNPF